MWTKDHLGSELLGHRDNPSRGDWLGRCSAGEVVLSVCRVFRAVSCQPRAKRKAHPRLCARLPESQSFLVLTDES